MERKDRLNSLLKEVISEVITRDVRNPKVHTLITVVAVDVSKDLHNATVYISVIGSEEDKKKTLQALRSAAGYISVQASKKVVLRYFPHLSFQIDDGVDAHLKIDAVLQKIRDEEQQRNTPHDP